MHATGAEASPDVQSSDSIVLDLGHATTGQLGYHARYTLNNRVRSDLTAAPGAERRGRRENYRRRQAQAASDGHFPPRMKAPPPQLRVGLCATRLLKKAL